MTTLRCSGRSARRGAQRAAISVFLLSLPAQAFAQTFTRAQQPSVTSLLNSGYVIAAASSSGASQFLYLQGADANGRKKAYACQLQFGPSGGFRGCLVLP